VWPTSSNAPDKRPYWKQSTNLWTKRGAKSIMEGFQILRCQSEVGTLREGTTNPKRSKDKVKFRCFFPTSFREFF